MKSIHKTSTPGVPSLSVIQVSVKTLQQDPKNARVHNKRQINHLVESIRSFGFNVPVLVDGQNQVIAGHGRLEAAQKLGLDTVPMIRLEHLTPTQIRAFQIADNRLTELATWDDQLLAEQLGELAKADLDFSIEATDLCCQSKSPTG